MRAWRNRLAAVASAIVGLVPPLSALAECKLVSVAELPVLVERHRILIPSEINGRAANFILDTGASRSLLFTSAASRYGVPTQNVRSMEAGMMYGIGGNIALRWAEIARLKLGPVDMSRAQLLVGGDRAGEADDIVGLIGYDVFPRYDIEFDLAHKAVRLLKSSGCTDDEMDYWRAPYAVAPLVRHGGEDNGSYVQVRLNGVNVEAMLDSGSPRSTVTVSAAGRAGVRPDSPGVEKVGMIGGISGSTTPVWAAPFKSFSIGEETIANPTLTMADLFGHTMQISTGTSVPTEIAMPGMLVGLDFFMAHRVLIARDHQKVYFSYNGGPIFEPPQREMKAASPSKPTPGAAAPGY